MNRPDPVRLFHFTHVDNLAGIVRDGLVCDSTAHVAGRLTTEVGNQEVKALRRQKVVDAGPGGVVADYVPFYFTARNLMLYQIHTRRVPSYDGGQSGLLFLCTTLERITALGLRWVASDRNASTAIARFTSDPHALDGHIDWPLATSSTFNSTPADPDRPQRHQAELLVHGQVPVEAMMFVGTRDASDLQRVGSVLDSMQGSRPKAEVRSDWFFI